MHEASRLDALEGLTDRVFSQSAASTSAKIEHVEETRSRRRSRALAVLCSRRFGVFLYNPKLTMLVFYICIIPRHIFRQSHARVRLWCSIDSRSPSSSVRSSDGVPQKRQFMTSIGVSTLTRGVYSTLFLKDGNMFAMFEESEALHQAHFVDQGYGAAAVEASRRVAVRGFSNRSIQIARKWKSTPNLIACRGIHGTPCVS